MLKGRWFRLLGSLKKGRHVLLPLVGWLILFIETVAVETTVEMKCLTSCEMIPLAKIISVIEGVIPLLRSLVVGFPRKHIGSCN